MKKAFYVFFLFFLFFPFIFAEEMFTINYIPGEKYKITEISDFRKYLNGKYHGFVSRQVKGIMDVIPRSEGGFSVNGRFYIFEETKHNTNLIANQIDTIIPAQFSITPDGRYVMSGDNYYPTTRDFPVFPNKKLNPGDSWRAYGIRYIEPFRDGVFTRVKFYCEYVYQGIKEEKDQSYHLITAQYALRYKSGDDPKGDSRIKEIKYAGHKVTIKFDQKNSKPVSMVDQIIENLGGEEYQFSDGTSMTLKGVTTTYFNMIERMDKEKIVEDIEEDMKKDKDLKDIDIAETEEGVKMVLNNIHFVADQAIILPEETKRLAALAEQLKKIKNRTFLVVGHTAKAGTEKEQYELSVKRAKAIVDYFVSRGLEAKRFLYEGRGATEPVAPNDTEENMKKNRRVEIIILED
ncbi:MAG: OmpA family protein [Spirochaetales bacterium]|nr:OmpA family protein [Spirochaetales bacterium]